MNAPTRFRAAVSVSLLAAVWCAGCARFRPADMTVGPPAGYRATAQASQAGFQAVYEGELRIWFHSFRALWVVAVEPGGTHLAVAVLSPTGIKLMQMQGTPDDFECVVTLPAAERLKPYGEALWDGLWWSLATGADRIRIRAARPRCRLTLTLRSIHWKEHEEDIDRDTGS